MSVTKFKHQDDARRALWVDSLHPSLASRIRRLWEFSERLAPRQIPRGVRRFRSIEGANRERDEWVRRRVDMLRNRKDA